MKLKNYNGDSFYTIDTYVMRGTIQMTHNEYDKVYDYLSKEKTKAIKNVDTYKRDSLYSLKKETKRMFSVGVCATKLIVDKYGLKNYKDVNYGIHVT